jgi:NADPH-dependent 2,4-dienoyl-CoA reductase/sulfur reductase-like enzyme
MKHADVVIVGGSAAGPVAVMTARRHYPDKSVLEIRREKPERVMVPCGVPYIFGTLGATNKNVIADSIITSNGAELMIDEVTQIDRTAKTLTTASGESVGYDKLILATGSTPVSPPIPGKELENVFFVWKDADYLDEMLKKLSHFKDIVVIGGGFIGIEMADEIKKMGDKNVTIVEMLPHCLQLALDEDQCIEAEKSLASRGVRVLSSATAKQIVGEGKVSAVELGSGEIVKADAVIIGIGATPNTELARKAGLEIGPMRGIKVDEYMRTATDGNIFAVGDCADKVSFFTKKPSGLRLASIAAIEAHIAGANLFQLKRKNPGAIGVFATIIGQDCFSVAGLTEKGARDAGYDFVTGECTAADTHPAGIPGSKQEKIKLIVDKKSGKILGGEVTGGRTAAEVANILSAFIANDMTADQAATFQMGTQPALTASPIVYQIVNAAELALTKMR